MGGVKHHWTERSTKDYLFSITADFIDNLEDKMEAAGVVAKNDVSKISLREMVEYARKLGMKVSVVAYEDGDPENKKGPINSEIFRACWEKCGKPKDFWDLQDKIPSDVTTCK
jgi:hypothetical protein